VDHVSLAIMIGDDWTHHSIKPNLGRSPLLSKFAVYRGLKSKSTFVIKLRVVRSVAVAVISRILNLPLLSL